MVKAPQARRRGLVLAAVVASVLVTGCSPVEADPAAQERAEQLVADTRAAGVAPRLTVDTVTALYGTEAPTACHILEDGLSDSARLAVFGNLAHGRRKAVTDQAVTYGRLVVQTYCPDRLGAYDEVVALLGPIETDAG